MNGLPFSLATMRFFRLLAICFSGHTLRFLSIYRLRRQNTASQEVLLKCPTLMVGLRDLLKP